jgi:hypothetical protein
MRCPLPFHHTRPSPVGAHLHGVLALQVTQLSPQRLPLFPLSSNGRLELLRLPQLPGNGRLQLACLIGGSCQRRLAILVVGACAVVVEAGQAGQVR